MSEDDARSGRRGNGLTAAAYAVLGHYSPQVGEALLAALADRGLAAYAVPHAGEVGGYLEIHPPSAPTVRLWVDASALGAAREVLGELTPQEPDEEAAWRDIVASLRRDGPDGPAPWPGAEEVRGLPPRLVRRAPPPAPVEPTAPVEQPAGVEDEHFEPVPPPPLPRVAPQTAYGIAAVVGGFVVLVVPTMTGDPVGPGLMVIAALAIIGGFAALVARMREGPPTDSGPDDGAVV